QEPVVAADPGDAAAVAGAAVEGDELAHQVAVADLQRHGLAAVLLVLRIAADRGVADDAVPAPDPGRAVHAAVRPDRGAVADLHPGTDPGERAHRHPFAKPRRWIHDRGGMDVRGHLRCAPRHTGFRRRPPA